MRQVRRALTSSLVVAFSLLLMPAITWAQGSSAAGIVGTVKDTSGAVLPGVTIEAASPALIEKVRSTVSDEKGEYRIIELRPGTYSVTFTLPGFATFKRDGLELGSSFTATVNVDMKVGGLEETVTVSGETPLVDTSSVSQQKAMSKTLLDTVPTGKSIYGFVSLMPAAIGPTAQQDVGGGLGDSTMRITIHGAKGDDARLLMDGISYNVLNANGTARGFMVNPLTAQEVVLDAGGGGSAEWGTGGAIVNMINKDGGNKFSGTLFGSGSTDKLQNDNLTDDIKARGLATAGKSVRIYDANGVIGGPIRQDKLWFSSSHRRSGHRDLIGGLYRDANFDARVIGAPAAVWKFAPDTSRPVAPVEDNEAHNIRLTWQAAADAQIRLRVRLAVEPGPEQHPDARHRHAGVGSERGGRPVSLHAGHRLPDGVDASGHEQAAVRGRRELRGPQGRDVPGRLHHFGKSRPDRGHHARLHL